MKKYLALMTINGADPLPASIPSSPVKAVKAKPTPDKIAPFIEEARRNVPLPDEKTPHTNIEVLRMAVLAAEKRGCKFEDVFYLARQILGGRKFINLSRAQQDDVLAAINRLEPNT